MLGDFMANYNLWYNALFENTTDGIIRFNQNHIVVDVNQGFLDLFEYNKEEIIGQDIDDIFDATKANSANRELTNQLLKGISSKDKDYRYSKNGKEVCCIIQGIPIKKNGEFIGGYAMYLDITELEETKATLSEERIRYSELVNQMSEGVILHNNDEEFIYANEAACDIFELPKDELIGKSINDFINKEDQAFIRLETKLRKQKKIGKYNLAIQTPSGNNKIIKVTAKALKGQHYDKNFHIYATFSDITSQFKAQEQIKKSEKQFRSLIQSMEEGVALCEEVNDDTTGEPIDFKVIEMNPKFKALVGIKSTLAYGYHGSNFLSNNYKKYLKTLLSVKCNKNNHQFKYYDKARDKHYQVSIFIPEKNRFGILLKDITKEQRIKNRIDYLTYHDKLTGLYNRLYLEEQFNLIRSQDTSIGIIMADANALKLINDVYNHSFGDELLKKIADVLEDTIGKQGIITRWGGDEFIVLFFNTPKETLSRLTEELRLAFSKSYINNIPVSVSIGCHVGHTSINTVSEIINSAEEMMYKNKLIKSSAVKRDILHRIFDQLIEENLESLNHITHMQAYLKEFSQALNLSATQEMRLISAAKFHDIGKITIPNEILLKDEALNPIEWDIIKKHSVSSYRILKSTEEYSFISSIVLHHHEWYNGTGYPGKLIGEDIPLLSRMISIVEAYDVMTHNQHYKSRISDEAAKRELIEQKSIQFDPKLVDIFIQDVLEKS